MVAPNPFKYKCPNCNYEKIIKPKSDVIDYHPFCPKCNSMMLQKELDLFDKILMRFKKF